MAKDHLSTLLELVQKYSDVYRGPYSISRVNLVTGEPGEKILRESLADHVGMLPIVATYIYPNLEVNKLIKM